MGTELFIVSRDEKSLFPLPDGRRVETYDLPPGAMWRCDCHNELGWLIMLPNNAGPWCTLATAGGTGNRWTVTGEPPKLTVKPSINSVGQWHGWITDGVMSPA
jgi:hypothetical protein